MVTNERQAIANEIHDSLSQHLFFARLRAALLAGALEQNQPEQAQQYLQDITEALEASQQATRELITHFRCQMDPQGLSPALQRLMNKFRHRFPIALDYTPPPAVTGLTMQQKREIFQVVQEALNNIVNHSGATEASVVACEADGLLSFTIADNGNGMNLFAPPAAGHYGLTIMHERARQIGARLEISSSPGSGTSIRLMLTPL
jgi:two-component system nitrate/nitrite sensor histidine kinase NarQ